MVLHGFEDRLDGFPAKVIFTAGGQSVGLVDKKHPAQGGLYGLLGLKGGLPNITCHKARAVDLNELALAQNAYGGVEPAYEPGHGGLTRSGVAHEHHVQGHGRHGQAVFPAQGADLHQVHKVFDVLFHSVQSHKSLKPCH